MLYVHEGNSVVFSCKLDQPSKSGAGNKAVSAMNMFKMMDKKGAVSTTDNQLDTKHKNAILQVKPSHQLIILLIIYFVVGPICKQQVHLKW